jgi:hypothetical protein
MAERTSQALRPGDADDVRHRLVGSYRLDESDEQFMERLNDALARFEEEGYAAEAEGSLPGIFVVGAPRTGTTLVVQLLASHLEIGWISNLAAAFWRAPCTGIRLHRRLLGDDLDSSFHSRAGRTDTITEPHEFGYFWRRLLGHGLTEPEPGSRVDWPTARRTLLHMNRAWGRPIIYKAFQLGFHITEAVAAMPRSLFVHVRRDPVDTALSILRTRVAMTGSDESWISLRPRGFEAFLDRAPAEQVAWQVLSIEKGLTRQLEQLPEANVVEIDFDELARRPGAVLARVRTALETQGCSVPRRRQPPEGFTPDRAADRSSRRVEVSAAIERMRASGLG